MENRQPQGAYTFYVSSIIFNSAINPVIYLFYNRLYRQELLRFVLLPCPNIHWRRQVQPAPPVCVLRVIATQPNGGDGLLSVQTSQRGDGDPSVVRPHEGGSNGLSSGLALQGGDGHPSDVQSCGDGDGHTRERINPGGAMKQLDVPTTLPPSRDDITINRRGRTAAAVDRRRTKKARPNVLPLSIISIESSTDCSSVSVAVEHVC